MEDIFIRPLVFPEEALLTEEIQMRAWGTTKVTPHHVLIAAGHMGGSVFAAYIGNKMVGFVFGFLGMHDDELVLYSHQLAVLPEYQDRNIGYMLKMEQAKHAKMLGVNKVMWTFDPLQSKNAYFNINKLGTVARIYLENHYGLMDDELNRGLPSDRFMVEWFVNSRWVKYGASSKYKYMEEYPLSSEVRYALKAELKEDIPVPRDVMEDGEIVAIEIPSDINYIKRKDIKIAHEWRNKLRALFREYIGRGYWVYRYLLYKEFGWKGAYILTRVFNLDEYRRDI